MKVPMCRQCVLERPDGRMVSWIPAEHAVVGRRLRLKEDGVWSENWTVVEAWSKALPTTWVEERSRDHLKTRRASDI